MTNEEIQRRYDEMERDLPIGVQMTLEDHYEVERRVMDFARALVSQAYEEAAQFADGLREFQSPLDESHALGARQAAEGIGRYIRALKDPLLPVESDLPS